jgi:hypothetical protein
MIRQAIAAMALSVIVTPATVLADTSNGQSSGTIDAAASAAAAANGNNNDNDNRLVNQNFSLCLTGAAAGSDYAEYDEDFDTGGWKSHSGVAIASESLSVVLSVVDSYGNSICANTADLTTACKFKADFASTFTIRIDNTMNADQANFSICAF